MPKKVYVTDPEIARKRGVHTVYVGVTERPAGDQAAGVIGVKFVNGLAKDVDENTFRRLKDLGHASESKPSVGDDD